VSLCTVAEAKSRIRALSTTAEDTRLTALVSAVSTAIARWCRYPGTAPSMESTTYTHYRSGPTPDETGRILRLPVRPVVSVTSVYDDPDWAYDSTHLVSSADYAVDLDAGTITLGTSADLGVWSSEPRAQKVTYVAGYATVPDDLKQAAVALVEYWWTWLDSQQDANVTVYSERATGPMPKHVAGLLGPFKLTDAGL